MRKAVKEFNLFLAGGITTEAERVYGRGSRGNVDHVGDRTDLGEEIDDVDLAKEKKIKTLHYNFAAREYREEPAE
jgi:hypothetical protein